MEITSCPYSEIPESRMELRQLPTQCAMWPQSSPPLSHPQGCHQGKHTGAHAPLSHRANALPPGHGPDLCFFFLENATFLSHLPMSKQLLTMSTIHRFRHEE